MTVDFAKADQQRYYRSNSDPNCKLISDIESTVNKDAPATAFAKFSGCGKGEEQKAQEKTDEQASVFRVISLVGATAVVQMRSYSDDTKSKLVAVDISGARVPVRQIIESGNTFIVSQNLKDNVGPAKQSLSAVIVRNLPGRCVPPTGEPSKASTTGVDFETCLRFVDNSNGALLDVPRLKIPTFDGEESYEPVRICVIGSAKTVIEFSERPTRWSIETSQHGSLPSTLVPSPSREAERASTEIIKWLRVGTTGYLQEPGDQRRQYRPEISTLRSLSFERGSAQLSSFFVKPDLSEVTALSRQTIRVADGVDESLRYLMDILPSLISTAGDKILLAYSEKLYGLSVPNSDGAKPTVVKPEVIATLTSTAMSKGCSSDDNDDIFIQKILEWPGRNASVLLLDRSGRIWTASPRTDKTRNEAPKQVQELTSLETAHVEREDRGFAVACLARSNLNSSTRSPVVAIEPTTGHLLFQTDSRILKIADLSETDTAPVLQSVSEGPFDDDIVAATFINADRIAILHKKGALTLLRRAGERWISRVISDVGFVSEFDKPTPPLMRANGNHILIVYDNRSILLDADEHSELSVIGAGVLPGSPAQTVLLNFNDDLTIDLLSDAQIMRVRLTRIPSPTESARILTARYLPVEGLPKDMIQLQTRLDLDESATTSKLRRLAALEDSSRCRIILQALFAPAVDNSDNARRLTLGEEAREACGRSSRFRWPSDAVSLAIEKVADPWPRSASNILRAAVSGDAQAWSILAGWLSNEISGSTDKARQADVWQRLLSRTMDRERQAVDPKMAQLIDGGPNQDKELQQIAADRSNSLDPRISRAPWRPSCSRQRRSPCGSISFFAG